MKYFFKNKIILIVIIIIFKNIKTKLNGVYTINCYSNNKYFKIKNNFLTLNDKKRSYFQIKKENYNSYFIELSIYQKKRLGIDENNEIITYNQKENINIKKITWNIIKVYENYYIIQNNFNQKILEENNNYIRFVKINLNKSFIDIFNNNNFLFNIIKIYDKVKLKKNDIKMIKNEPIDAVIKYIDLTDKTLNRTGINQTYKDQDNEELRYSLRSIFYYIPWVRKIFILMPNEKVKYLKNIEIINDKIIYIKDNELLGYDSANIQSFLFSLDKMEKFGISKNFIYMEDDCFVGNFLKKKHLFYYDESKKKIYPNVITWGFYEINKTEVLENYFNLYNIKDLINAHSKEGFLFQKINTEKFFIDNYNMPLTRTLYTHNAIPENIDDLKEINNIAKKYIYFNETLYNIERNAFSLCHEHFFNLYQLNINHRKVRPILSLYVPIEKMKKMKLNRALFVINTGGNHIPLERHYKIQKKIMNKRFPFKIIYEILNNNNNFNYLKKSFKYFFNSFLFLILLKIYKILLFFK